MQGFPFIKPTFLKVGGSVWEFKIVPKRLREEIKNDIEKQRKKRDENKSLKGDKKSSKKLCHRLARQQGFYDEKERRAVWSAEAPRSAPLRAVR